VLGPCYYIRIIFECCELAGNQDSERSETIQSLPMAGRIKFTVGTFGLTVQVPSKTESYSSLLVLGRRSTSALSELSITNILIGQNGLQTRNLPPGNGNLTGQDAGTTLIL